MKKVRKAFLWAFLLNKRFLRKPLLLLLLCLIPLTAFLAVRLPVGSGSLLSVGLATDQKEDELAAKVMRKLTRESDSAVRFISYDSGDRLREAVRSGKVRLGFLFPDDLSALIDAYAHVEQPSSSGGALGALSQALGLSKQQDVDLEGMQEHAIRVICGSNDIVTKLEKEQFFGKLYGEIGNAVLHSWMDVHAADFPMSKQERDEYLDKAMKAGAESGDFFSLSLVSGDAVLDQDLDSWFLAPIRGLLAVTLILVGAAACLYLMNDKKKGLFVWVRPEMLPFFHYLYLLIPVADGGIFAGAALFLLGALKDASSLWAGLLFLISVTGFANLVRILTRRITLFSAAIPIMIMGSLFLTPVFFDLRIMPAVQALLPTYFFLKALSGEMSLLPLFLYAAVSTAASLILDKAAGR